MELLEDNATNERLGQALERVHVQQANAGEELARACRRVVVARWLALLQEIDSTIKSKGSADSLKQRFGVCVKGATADLVRVFDRTLLKFAEVSFSLVDRAMFLSLTEEQARHLDFAESEASDYAQGNDPLENWPAGRKIHPLPPEPEPTRKVRYVGAGDRKPTTTTNLKIVKAGKYRERLEKWSKQITNKKAVAEEIAKRVAAGQSLEKIAKAIEPHVRNISSSAMRIARTETARIHNEVAELNWNEYDSLIAGFRVINPLDEVTRPTHRARASEKNRGQPQGRIYWKPEFAPKGAKYFVEDRPSLPDEPNCRCGYTPVFRPDLAEKEVVADKKKAKEATRKVNQKKVVDIEGDATEQELEAFRAAKRGKGEKKARAGIRGASTAANEKIVGTKEYEAAKAKRAAAIKPVPMTPEKVREVWSRIAKTEAEVRDAKDPALRKSLLARREKIRDELRSAGENPFTPPKPVKKPLPVTKPEPIPPPPAEEKPVLKPLRLKKRKKKLPKK